MILRFHRLGTKGAVNPRAKPKSRDPPQLLNIRSKGGREKRGACVRAKSEILVSISRTSPTRLRAAQSAYEILRRICRGLSGAKDRGANSCRAASGPKA